MKEFEDLTGKKFGLLTVICHYDRDNKIKKHRWLCQCECGNYKIIQGNHLKSGAILSCGCFGKKQRAKATTTHGLSTHPLYWILVSMKDRCYNKNCKSYSYYGGRGIAICQEWLDDFMNFYNWSMANGYKENLTIDRIDVNSNYEPSNCRWVTVKEQNRNQRSNVLIEYNNETHCISEWEEILNTPPNLIGRRYRKGWSLDKVFAL